MSFGGNEMMIVLLIVLVLFGGAKIPQLMKGVGEGMRELKKAQREDPEPPFTSSTGVATPRDETRNPIV